MDSNTNNTASSVPPSGSNGSVPPAPTSVYAPNPGSAQAAAPSQNTPVTPQHKGKPMMRIVVLLLVVFICGLALAAWYFQTQLQKF